jgi:hypothetical protein
MNTPQTMKEAQEHAAANGILFTEAELIRINKIQATTRAGLLASHPVEAGGWIAWWKDLYPRLLAMILSIGETILTFAQTVIVAVGVPIVLILLMIVEHQRVMHGIMLFESSEALASFASMSLVVLNLVLEFTIHHVEHMAGYVEPRAARWSLVLLGRRLSYALGIVSKGEQWREQELSPAHRFKGLLNLVTYSILALALAGSMRAVIERVGGAWYTGLISIVTTSTLLEIFTWVSGMVFAVAAVRAAQGLSRYVAIRCIEIIAAMNKEQAALKDPFEDEVERAGALAMHTIIMEKLKTKERRAQASTPTLSSTAATPEPTPEPEPLPEQETKEAPTVVIDLPL